MTTDSDNPDADRYTRELHAAREAAFKATRRAEKARKWLDVGQVIAFGVGLFFLLSAMKTWVPPISDGAIVVVIVIIGLLVLISAWEA